MFSIIILILSLLIFVIFGAGILFLICPKSELALNKTKFIIFSFAIGTGLGTFIFFWASLIGLDFFSLAIAFVIIDAVFLILFFKSVPRPVQPNQVSPNQDKFDKATPSRMKPGKKVKQKIWQTLLILIIIFQIGFVFSSALLRPVINFDALDNWAFKAKVFFYQPAEAFSSKSDLFLGGGAHQNYPLHTPLLMAWFYSWLGEVDDVSVGLIFAFYFLALIIFIYDSLRKNKSKINSLIFTAVLASLPLLAYHGSVAYADLTLSFYFTLAAISLFNYLKYNKKIDLIGLSFFSGLCVWIKNTGIVLAGLVGLVFLIYYLWKAGFFKIKRAVLMGFLKKYYLKFIFGVGFFAVPWLIFKSYFNLGFSNVSPDQPVSLIGFHPEVAQALFEQIFIFNSFHIWPGIFLAILIIYWKKVFTSPNIFLFLIFCLTLFFFFALYFFTDSYEFALQGTLVSRHLLALAPLSIFLAGLLTPDL